MACGILWWLCACLGERGAKVKPGKTARKAKSNGRGETANRKARAVKTSQQTCDIDPDSCASMRDYSGSAVHASVARPCPCAREAKPVINLDGNEYVLRIPAADTDAFVSNLKKSERTEDALQRAYKGLESLQADLRGAKERESSKHAQLLQAENDIVHLEKCLNDCKDRIFEMQPIEHMTDAQVAEQYVTLCEAVSDWTDQQFGELDDPLEAINDVMQRGTTRQVIKKCLVSTGDLDIARTDPLSGCIVLTSFIYQFLHQSILQETIFFPGLSPAWENFVSFMEGGMRTLQPARGDASLWLFFCSD
jgi:hypothetical protein